MVAARRRHPAAGLFRVALLATVLAVLAGLLGMHVFSDSHVAHSAAAVEDSVAEARAPVESADAAAASHSTSGHSANGHAAASHPGTATRHETPAPPSCGCGGDCGDQTSAHVSCTPAPSGASLSAPPPGTTLLAVQPRTAPPADPATAYSYLPATPTPNELSISRT